MATTNNPKNQQPHGLGDQVQISFKPKTQAEINTMSEAEYLEYCHEIFGPEEPSGRTPKEIATSATECLKELNGWNNLDQIDCNCQKKDAWKCAVHQGLKTVACHCECHRTEPEQKYYVVEFPGCSSEQVVFECTSAHAANHFINRHYTDDDCPVDVMKRDRDGNLTTEF